MRVKPSCRRGVVATATAYLRRLDLTLVTPSIRHFLVVALRRPHGLRAEIALDRASRGLAAHRQHDIRASIERR
jgi:hypothetical protein